MNEAIKNFVDHVNQIFAKTDSTTDRKSLVTIPGAKWTKCVCERRTLTGELISSNAYAFVSMTDNYTKTLGQLVAGGIYKPASWAAPAKHARGNVNKPETYSCAGEFGIVYLK
jgi:hypothetical protein